MEWVKGYIFLLRETLASMVSWTNSWIRELHEVLPDPWSWPLQYCFPNPPESSNTKTIGIWETCQQKQWNTKGFFSITLFINLISRKIELGILLKTIKLFKELYLKDCYWSVELFQFYKFWKPLNSSKIVVILLFSKVCYNRWIVV